MAAMAVNLVSTIGEESIIILDAYFSVGSVFSMLEQAVDEQGKRLLHVITRAKSNVVAFMDPPEKSGKCKNTFCFGSRWFCSVYFDELGLELVSIGYYKILQLSL